MNTIELTLPFKGDRNYIHSTDVINESLKQLVELNDSENISVQFNEMLYFPVMLVEIPPIELSNFKKSNNVSGLIAYKTKYGYEKLLVLVQNRDMISEFFPNSKKISLVPRGVDLNEFKKKPKNLSLLKKYNLRYEDKIILCVANLHPVKGVEILIKAFELLSQNKKEIKLFIVGENKNVYGEQLLKIAQSSKFSSDIIFTGKVNNVSEYYNLADLFVLPTHKNGRREGCPVSLLEAISSGINVLGSDVSGIKDILEKFPNLIFESGNSIQLYNKIKLILRNGKTLNKAVKNHIKQYYNIKVEAENHQIVYKKILIKK